MKAKYQMYLSRFSQNFRSHGKNLPNKRIVTQKNGVMAKVREGVVNEV